MLAGIASGLSRGITRRHMTGGGAKPRVDEGSKNAKLSMKECGRREFSAYLYRQLRIPPLSTVFSCRSPSALRRQSPSIPRLARDDFRIATSSVPSPRLRCMRRLAHVPQPRPATVPTFSITSRRTLVGPRLCHLLATLAHPLHIYALAAPVGLVEPLHSHRSKASALSGTPC